MTGEKGQVRRTSKLSSVSSTSTRQRKNSGQNKKQSLQRSSSEMSHAEVQEEGAGDSNRKTGEASSLAEWAHVRSKATMNPYADGDPFQCECTACKNFWKKNFGDNTQLLSGAALDRSRSTGPMFYVKNLEVKLGDRVLVWRTHKGVVRYIGPLSDDLVSPHLYIGVQLDDNINSLSSGIHKGKRYFKCPPGHGAFVHYQDIIVAESFEKVPGLSDNEMFASHRQIVAERKQKREKDPTYDLGTTYREEKAREPDLVQALPTSRKVGYDRIIYDHNDTAYKDYIRYVNRPQPPPKQVKTLTAREKRNMELKKEFGGGERADKMVDTVDKLREAFKEGLELAVAENATRESTPPVQLRRKSMFPPRKSIVPGTVHVAMYRIGPPIADLL